LRSFLSSLDMNERILLIFVESFAFDFRVLRLLFMVSFEEWERSSSPSESESFESTVSFFGCSKFGFCERLCRLKRRLLPGVPSFLTPLGDRVGVPLRDLLFLRLCLTLGGGDLALAFFFFFFEYRGFLYFGGETSGVFKVMFFERTIWRILFFG